MATDPQPTPTGFPNAQQRLVLEHRGQPLVVVAGPGTGKTKTLVERVIQLLQQDSTIPVGLITFTRLSRRGTAKQIRERVEGVTEDLPGTAIPRVATVHTFAKGLVHTYAGEAGLDRHFHVLIESNGEVDLVIREVLYDLGLERAAAPLKRMIASARNSGAVLQQDGVSGEDAARIIDAFDGLSSFYNAIDMEGLVVRAERLAREHPEHLAPLLLHVDEYQDLNVADQALIATLLTQPIREVVAVGDDAQSIYSFRDAYPRGIRDRFRDAAWKPVRFEECIRLPRHIRRASQALLQKSTEEYLGALPASTQPEEDGRVALVQYTKPKVEVDGVVLKIRALKEGGASRDGRPLRWRDFMILCTAGTQVNTFLQALDEAGIPARTKSNAGASEDVWRILLALRLAARDDSLALRQCLDLAGVAWPTVQQWRQAAIGSGKSLFEHLSAERPAEAVPVLEAVADLRGALPSPGGFLEELRRFPGVRPEAETLSEYGLTEAALGDGPVNPGALLAHIYEDLGLLDSEDVDSEEDKVLVTTIHSSKGLEAEFVFCVRLDNRFLPQPGRDREEQRRLLYVAMTRAKQDLYLSFHERFDPAAHTPLGKEALSPFLKEIESALAWQRIRKSDLVSR